MERLGERIKDLRDELNLNKTELANKAGITVASISRFESGIKKRRGKLQY